MTKRNKWINLSFAVLGMILYAIAIIGLPEVDKEYPELIQDLYRGNILIMLGGVGIMFYLMSFLLGLKDTIVDVYEDLYSQINSLRWEPHTIDYSKVPEYTVTEDQLELLKGRWSQIDANGNVYYSFDGKDWFKASTDSIEIKITEIPKMLTATDITLYVDRPWLKERKIYEISDTIDTKFDIYVEKLLSEGSNGTSCSMPYFAYKVKLVSNVEEFFPPRMVGGYITITE